MMHARAMDQQITNSSFLDLVAQSAPSGTALWVNHFIGEPRSTVWAGQLVTSDTMQAVDRWQRYNTYFAVAALNAGEDGQFARRKANFARLLVLVVDDPDESQLVGSPSYVLATSPGKVQVGILLDEHDPDCANLHLIDRLVKVLTSQGLMGGDISGNNAVRYVRLPVGQNQKHRAEGPFDHRLLQWNPQIRLTLDDACAVLGIDLDTIRRAPADQPVGAIDGQQSDKLRDAARMVIEGNYHEPINIIAASMLASGSAAGSVVNMLRGLMDASTAPHDARWRNRYDDIPRAVSTAQEKFERKVLRPTIEQDQTLEWWQAGELPPVSTSEVFADELIERTIARDSIFVIYGDSNSGKTFFAIDMAASLARGARWMDRNTEQNAVLYLATESPESVRLRLRAYQHHRKVRLGNFFVVGSPISLFDSEADIVAVVQLVEQIKKDTGHEVRLIIGDTLARLSSGANENSGEDMGVVLRNCDRLKNATKAAFGLIHHTGKDAAKGMRGWSGMRAFIDTEIEVTDDNGVRCAEITKQRDLDGKGERMAFTLDRVPMGVNKWGAPRSSAVVTPVAVPETVKTRRYGPVEGALIEFLQTRNTGCRRRELVAHLETDYAKVSVYRAIKTLISDSILVDIAGVIGLDPGMKK